MVEYVNLPDHLKQALDATKGSRLGAMLACAFMGQDQPTDGPYFSGKAVVTSDGYIMWDFTTKGGDFHGGALAGDWQSFMDNIRGLVVHLGWAYQHEDKQIPRSETARQHMVDLQDKLNAVLHYYGDHARNFYKELRGAAKVEAEAKYAAKRGEKLDEL